MRVLKWCISTLLAFVMQLTLDAILPDMRRLYVITIAGLVGMIWSSIDDQIRGLK